MTGNEHEAPVGVLDRIRAWFPADKRESFYRAVSAVSTMLMAFGLLNANQAALWVQLGLSTVSALFALLYATTNARAALYALVGPLGGVLMAYSIVNDIRWAFITAAVGQLFGITTAAAKTVQSGRHAKAE